MRFLSAASFVSSPMLTVLRIMAGLLFVEHGTTKILNFPPGAQGGGMGFHLNSLAGMSGGIELVGGALVVIGLFTRFAAFILAGEMAVAYFTVHWPVLLGKTASFYPILNKGEIALLYCFVFLYLAVAGPGPWSIDGMRRRL
jgi:putative oxidoreductase